MSISIVTDSNCDLPQAMVDEFGITVVPLYINIGQKSYLDGVEMSRQEFYEGLPHFDTHPMTSVPGPGVFVETFEALASEGATEILCVHIASSLSAMANSARLAAEQWDKLPVTVFDSGNLTLGTGLQAVAAAKAAAEGHSMAEIMALLEELAPRTYCFAALDTVEFLRRSGRLTRFQWGLASVLQIKPLLCLDDGHVGALAKPRTRPKAIRLLVRRMAEQVGDRPLHAAVFHADAPAEAEDLRQRLADQFDCVELYVTEFTPVMGAHTGPGLLGVAFYGE